jgi:hypothetical protein
MRYYFYGTQRGYVAYSGQDWGAIGNTRRVAVPFDVTGYGTGLYGGSSMTITMIGGPGSFYSTGNHIAQLVDRSSSHFGAGWWLSGLEQLVSAGGGVYQHIRGDGSSTQYVWNGTSYKAANWSYPDSITHNPSTGEFTRWGPEKLQVRFNSGGLHTSTVNRLGQTTTFAYAPGTSRLTSVSVPVASGTSLTYTFSYDGNNVLQQVAAPGSRTVTLGRSGQRITSITDPDGKTGILLQFCRHFSLTMEVSNATRWSTHGSTVQRGVQADRGSIEQAAGVASAGSGRRVRDSSVHAVEVAEGCPGWSFAWTGPSRTEAGAGA